MNEEFWRWYMYGHWICLTQWLGFIMVEYAYLGKGRVKHPLVWSGVITMLTMTLSVVHNFLPMAFLRRWHTGWFTGSSTILFCSSPSCYLAAHRVRRKFTAMSA